MLRLLLICALLAPVLAAQDAQPLTGSVPSNRRLTFLYSIDFGPTLANYSLACSLQTPSAAGLIVRLIDLDLVAGSGAAVPPGLDEQTLSGVGTANVSLSGQYAGMHEFMVEVESPGANSVFDGSLTTSLGLISFVSSDQLILSATGFRATVARKGVWDGSLFGSQLVASSFQMDLGPVSRTVFFRFEAEGSNIDEIHLIETTGGSSTIRATFNSGLPDATAVPITGSGIRTLRVTVRGQPSVTASARWQATAPSGVALSLVDTPPGDGGDDDEGGCAAGPAGAALAPLALLLFRRVPKRRAIC
jgi:hypothetical protein